MPASSQRTRPAVHLGGARWGTASHSWSLMSPCLDPLGSVVPTVPAMTSRGGIRAPSVPGTSSESPCLRLPQGCPWSPEEQPHRHPPECHMHYYSSREGQPRVLNAGAKLQVGSKGSCRGYLILSAWLIRKNLELFQYQQCTCLIMELGTHGGN